MNKAARGVSHAAIGAALDMVFLYLAQWMPTARLALLCVSSVGVIFVLMSSTQRYALYCYAVSALLALVLLPEKGIALVFALFCGYYPIVKLRLERVKKPLGRWVGKLLVFNGALAALLLLFSTLFAQAQVLPKLAWPLLWLGSNAVFLAYDFALTQIILIYIRRLKGRIEHG